jgi:hypothetical protein
MKKFLLLILFFSSSLKAEVELTFIGPCSEKFIMRTIAKDHFKNVGELTIGMLQKFQIPYEGSPEGLASAFETPTGEAAVEVISDEELRAYGWCFSVDGIAPEVYPHEALLTENTKSVVWHYGFARFFQGKWITQCTPAWKIKPRFICQDQK